MAKQHIVSGSFVRKYWFLPIVLVVLAVLAVFGPAMYNLLMSSLTPKQADAGFVAPLNHPTPYMVVHYCGDTPPLYSASLGSAAARSLADGIDSAAVPGFGGLKLYSSYISGHSFQNETGVVLTIPSLAGYPAAPPAPVYGTDSYKNALMKKAYEKAVAVWKSTVSHREQQVPALQQAVHVQTNKLRALTFPYNNTASDLLGCLADASAHFAGVPSSVSKQLIIASDLVNNVSSAELGSISLPGVSVSVVFFTCSAVASSCQARISYLARLVKRASAKSLHVFDVAQSQPFPVAL